MSQFHLPGPWTQECIPASESLSHHLRVRRIQSTETFQVFDGIGQIATAQISPDSTVKSVLITIQNIRQDRSAESPYPIELVQGIAGNDKMDWLIEKSVELGVTTIVPIQTERSVVRLDEKRAEKRLAHWQALVIAACEQSGRTVIPKIHPVIQLYNWLQTKKEATTSSLKIILSPKGDLGLVSILKRAPGQGVSLMIGPEGGFSPTEEALAIKEGYLPALLGNRVLRTETAGIVAMSAVHTLWGEF